MKGKIINFNQEKSFGFIMGENGKNYFFHTSDVDLPFEVSKNKMLIFTPDKNKKGLCAKKIILDKKNISKKSKQKKKNFVQIGDITVDLNDVKSAQVHGSYNNAKLLIKTYSSGTLVSYYTCYTCDCNDGYGSDYYAENDLKRLLDLLREL